MISHGLTWLATALLTTVVSIIDRRFTVARWDGEDWEFKWATGALYWDSPAVRPKFVTSQNMDLFLAEYRPQPGDVVFDVGAGVGTEIQEFSELVGPSGVVVAVEADPATARRLKKLVTRLRYQNVRVLELAVGASEGVVHLHIAEEFGVENSTAAVVGSESIAVPCKRLDRILVELDIPRVSYMKINIEGAEHEALLGLGDSIHSIDELCISCHDFTGVPSQATYADVHRYLADVGLDVMALPHNPSAKWENFYLFARQKK